MNRKVTIILTLIALSAGSTLWGLFLILTPQHTAVIQGTGGTSMGRAIYAVKRESPFFLIPMTVGILGWFATVYEAISLRRGEFTGSLRRKMSSEGFGRGVFRIFSSKGGTRRLAIMDALRTPKLRNEIANMTNTDWKEVDRNIEILEAANLVEKQFSHGSLSVYHLTQNGEELMEIIQSQKGTMPSEIKTVNF